MLELFRKKTSSSNLPFEVSLLRVPHASQKNTAHSKSPLHGHHPSSEVPEDSRGWFFSNNVVLCYFKTKSDATTLCLHFMLKKQGELSFREQKKKVRAK